MSISVQDPPPRHEQDFEELCCALFRKLWEIPDLQLYARRGHRQFGVDFFGTDEQGRVCGGQCKLHEHPHKLTEAEVEQEVEKAREFQPRLKKYAIATTSKRDPKLQQLASRMNADHRQEGIFQVVVYSWDDLLNLLKEYPEVRDQFYGGASAASMRAFKNDVQGFSTKLDRVLPAVSPESGHDKIDAACNFLRNRQIAEARLILDQLRQRSWDTLSDREKFRVLANLGYCSVSENESEKAASFFLDAVRYQADDQKARYLEVLAHSCLGDIQRAFELASVLREDRGGPGK